MEKSPEKIAKIAYCGRIGSFSHEAAVSMFENAQYLPFNTFSQAIDSVQGGNSHFAVIPIENSTAGRVAEIHNILPEMNLLIVKEKILPISHNLYSHNSDTKIENIKFVESHPQALMQCSNFIAKINAHEIQALNTAIAAENLAKSKKVETAVICSKIAGEHYGLSILAKNIQNKNNNYTTFIAVGKNQIEANFQNPITCVIFKLGNETGGIYNALGCFAKNSVNLLKLESYIPTGIEINEAQFFVIFEGDNAEQKVQKALEELCSVTSEIRNFGSYNGDAKRFY